MSDVIFENLTLKQLREISNLFNKSDSFMVKEDMRYVIVRAYSAGVFAGNIESKTPTEVVLRNVRRLWKWSGAASLSQLAMEGVKDPDECRFPCEVVKDTISGWNEILETTSKAEESIKNVKIWEM